MIRPIGFYSILLVAGMIVGQNGSLAPAEDKTRSIRSIAATRSGSVAVIALMDGGGQDHLLAFAPKSKQILWQLKPDSTPTVIASSPDEKLIAIGFKGVGSSKPGVLLLDAKSGQQIGALGWDEKLDFVPGQTYMSWGTGITQLAFSPDGALLYGLSNDTLFAWDLGRKQFLWIKDVPTVLQTPTGASFTLEGHSSGFALSPDGRQIAAIRGALRIGAAGAKSPAHFIRRDAPKELLIASDAFSADNKILAAGEYAMDKGGQPVAFATDLWINGSTKSVSVVGCGNNIAWTGAPDVFACQNASGAHLRNIHDPQKDIGQAGPVSDLPLLKVGNSIWAAAYKTDDWKNPTQPLPLTLVEVGTGKRVTITLPGRQ